MENPVLPGFPFTVVHRSSSLRAGFLIMTTTCHGQMAARHISYI
jgi:hypothetical protein